MENNIILLYAKTWKYECTGYPQDAIEFIYSMADKLKDFNFDLSNRNITLDQIRNNFGKDIEVIDDEKYTYKTQEDGSINIEPLDSNWSFNLVIIYNNDLYFRVYGHNTEHMRLGTNFIIKPSNSLSKSGEDLLLKAVHDKEYYNNCEKCKACVLVKSKEYAYLPIWICVINNEMIPSHIHVCKFSKDFYESNLIKTDNIIETIETETEEGKQRIKDIKESILNISYIEESI